MGGHNDNWFHVLSAQFGAFVKWNERERRQGRDGEALECL